MSTLGAFLAAAVGPLAKKVLQALGIGVISYAGITVALNAAINQVKASYGSIPGQLADLINYTGLGTAIGIILGAILARVSFMITERLGRVAS